MRQVLRAVMLLVLGTTSVRAWEIGEIPGDKLEKGRITCGLLEKYGPSRSYRDLAIAIPDSPYGPLRLEMTKTLGLRVMADRYKSAPAPDVTAKILAWVVAQLPEKPKACTFLFADQAWLVRVGYPDDPPVVPEEDYISIQLDLAQQAATVEPEWVSKWTDGALLALNGLDAPKRRKYQRDPRMRAAAYTTIERPAPDGLSDIGKRGYCDLYDSVQKLFPPRTAKEKRTLAQGRRTVGCR